MACIHIKSKKYKNKVNMPEVKAISDHDSIQATKEDCKLNINVAHNKICKLK